MVTKINHHKSPTQENARDAQYLTEVSPPLTFL